MTEIQHATSARLGPDAPLTPDAPPSPAAPLGPATGLGPDARLGPDAGLGQPSRLGSEPRLGSDVRSDGHAGGRVAGGTAVVRGSDPAALARSEPLPALGGSAGLPWSRVLLKLSGEALSGGGGLGVDPDVVALIAKQVAAVARTGVQVAIVVGGGNYFRGEELSERGMDRSRADYMGILGTVINSLALQDFLEKQDIEVRVQTAITMGQVAEPYIPLRAIRHLEKGRVVIFGGGLGVPYFSTDTCAAQRALEIHCQVLLMGKNGVEGVYSADPRTNPDATFYRTLRYEDVLLAGLKVADATAFSLCMDNDLPIVVFDLLTEGNIARAVAGERIGTLVNSTG